MDALKDINDTVFFALSSYLIALQLSSRKAPHKSSRKATPTPCSFNPVSYFQAVKKMQLLSVMVLASMGFLGVSATPAPVIHDERDTAMTEISIKAFSGTGCPTTGDQSSYTFSFGSSSNNKNLCIWDTYGNSFQVAGTPPVGCTVTTWPGMNCGGDDARKFAASDATGTCSTTPSTKKLPNNGNISYGSLQVACT
ncbi:hypothetical protein N7462_008186 [Penicillium macrosclerotiorum]|uniref:uncharacterized protein n=1 Tax=Penicillium macrosclerotiorum TaxID=303699 RepID=UPI00254835FB|nr:uncharacterized protein N7462_008186 [Penicillium macrosclerotiorum]KAJ5679942.1 hypothetical protein N7462_008186 [Penicillium macrosclerotiorum]